MRRLKFAAIGLSLFSFFIFSSCGNEPSNQIGVFANPLCVILQTGQQQQFCAQVNDNLGSPVSQSVTWTIQGGSSSGTFNPTNGTAASTTTTANTQTVTYQAPAVVPSNCVVTIDAVSDQDNTSQNQVSILVVTDINGNPLSCAPPIGPTSCVKGPIAPICPPPAP